MSRKLKRVPLAFDWPLLQVWSGYLNPYYEQSGTCPACVHGFDRDGGRPDANAALFSDQWYGYAPFDPVAYGAVPIAPDDPAILDIARRNVARARGRRMYFPSCDVAIAEEVRRIHEDCFRGHWSCHLIQADVDALVAADRLWDFRRVPRDPEQALVVGIRMAFHATNSWLPESNGYMPTAAEVNAWARRDMGHDGINRGICVEARCAREGVPYRCIRCSGSGWIWPSSEIEKQCEDWTQEEPPDGEGYQLWEDVSEGSPVSPVFATLDALCSWCAENATTWGIFKATAEEWREMLDGGVVHARIGNALLL